MFKHREVAFKTGNIHWFVSEGGFFLSGPERLIFIFTIKLPVAAAVCLWRQNHTCYLSSVTCSYLTWSEVWLQWTDLWPVWGFICPWSSTWALQNTMISLRWSHLPGNNTPVHRCHCDVIRTESQCVELMRRSLSLWKQFWSNSEYLLFQTFKHVEAFSLINESIIRENKCIGDGNSCGGINRLYSRV